MFDYAEQIRLNRELVLEGLKWVKTATKEEKLARFVSAGILDENGEFTEPYAILKGYVKFRFED